MVTKGLQPALEVYRQKGWWSQARHNWNQVCNGGIGIAALALLDELPDLCGEVLNHAVYSIQLPMQEFAPDGAWGEGPGYWNYATSTATWSSIHLRILTKTRGPKRKSSASFPTLTAPSPLLT